MNLFPKDFLWGASTAGHQVEGGNYDQWSSWELANAKKLADSAEKRLKHLPNWEKIRAQAQTPTNYISGKGVDHFHRYKEDFDILKKLGLNAFRFTIEWSRLEPEQGVWDETAIDHYHNYIAELKKRGIEPILNIWHWTHPVWFEEKGAFAKTGNIGYFLRFVTKIAEEFGEELKYVITINEPNIYITYSEWNGGVSVPPEYPLPRRVMMYLRLVKAHRMTYLILKKSNPDLQIGAAMQMSDNKTKTPRLLSKFSVYVANKFGNYFYYDRLKRHMDFIGFNYYFTNYFDGLKLRNPKTPKSDVGLYMEPSGVGEVAIKLWKRYQKPVMITENGIAAVDDDRRQWWLRETMQALVKARHNGVNLIGYLHWSLLDNFEWHHGWWPKFGLVEVDREHDMKRTIRPSAKWWAEQLAVLRKEQDQSL